MARNPLQYRVGLLGGGVDPLSSLHRDMNRLFDEVIGGGQPYAGSQAGQGSQGGRGQIINAPMNVSETEDKISLEAELPGVHEEDIDVSLNDDVLTIRGEKRFERKDEKENFHFVERSYGTFQRSVRLPFPINPDQVRASFENGVLTVTLPKAAQQERTRRIQVQRGATGSSGGQTIEGTTSGKGGSPQQGGNERKAGQMGGSKG